LTSKLFTYTYSKERHLLVTKVQNKLLSNKNTLLSNN